MSTSITTSAKAARAFRPSTALAKSVEFTDELMSVHLTDGRVVSVPIIWFPRLHGATMDQLSNVRIGAGGRGMHWPDLDEDVSVAGLLAGGDKQAS